MTEYISSNFDSTQVHLPVLHSWECEIDASGNTLYLTSSGSHGLPGVEGFHFESNYFRWSHGPSCEHLKGATDEVKKPGGRPARRRTGLKVCTFKAFFSVGHMV